jgi:hypothetical protein
MFSDQVQVFTNLHIRVNWCVQFSHQVALASALCLTKVSQV